MTNKWETAVCFNEIFPWIMDQREPCVGHSILFLPVREGGLTQGTGVCRTRGSRLGLQWDGPLWSPLCCFLLGICKRHFTHPLGRTKSIFVCFSSVQNSRRWVLWYTPVITDPGIINLDHIASPTSKENSKGWRCDLRDRKQSPVFSLPHDKQVMVDGTCNPGPIEMATEDQKLGVIFIYVDS